ncbi:PspC domain-containing protein [Bacillus fonticola]|uniref:PspC domain-containing protein n=1 Tax=Bacillus fonticola TaxID=2728853 RepID=UPI0014734430|nr:PspC domain-containing protein [Bacillus fonticola]
MNWVREQNDRKVAGVCGGIAKSLRMNSTLIRLLYMVVFVVRGFIPSLLVYATLVYIMPSEKKA